MISLVHVTDLHGTSAFSDDDEQFVECQSFTDSNRASLDSSDVLMRTVGGNVTITRETGEGDVSGTIDAGLQNLNSTQTTVNKSFKAETPNLNSTAETPADGTFNAGRQSLNSTQTPADGTFDAGSHSLNSSQPAVDGTFDAGTHSLNSTQTPSDGTFNTGTQSLNSTAPAADVTFDHDEPRVSTGSSDNFGSCSASSKSVEDIGHRESDFPEQPHKGELPEEIQYSSNVEPEKSKQGGNVTQEVHAECASASPEADEIQEVTSSVPQLEEDSQQVQIEETKIFENPSQGIPAPDAEEYFQNLDDISKSQTAVKMEAAFAAEPSQQTVEKNPFSPTLRTSENVFLDKVQSQFDVEFKKPAVPVFKQSSVETFADDEFNCGSSCKKPSEQCCVRSAFTNT